MSGPPPPPSLASDAYPSAEQNAVAASGPSSRGIVLPGLGASDPSRDPGAPARSLRVPPQPRPERDTVHRPIPRGMAADVASARAMASMSGLSPDASPDEYAKTLGVAGEQRLREIHKNAANVKLRTADGKNIWTFPEDRAVLQFVRDSILRGRLGPGVPYVDWPWETCSSSYLQTSRTAKQCRERWANVLNPFVKHDALWTREEMDLLIELHRTFGNKWREIAKRCPGRTTNKVKNLFYSCERRIRRSAPGTKEGSPHFNELIAKELYRVLATQPRSRAEPIDAPDRSRHAPPPPPHDSASAAQGPAFGAAAAPHPMAAWPSHPPAAVHMMGPQHGISVPAGYVPVAVPGGYALMPAAATGWPGPGQLGAHVPGAGGPMAPVSSPPPASGGFGFAPGAPYAAPPRVLLVRTQAGPMHLFPDGSLAPAHGPVPAAAAHHQPTPPSPSPWHGIPATHSPSMSSTATSPGVWPGMAGPYGAPPQTWTPPGVSSGLDPWAAPSSVPMGPAGPPPLSARAQPGVGPRPGPGVPAAPAPRPDARRLAAMAPAAWGLPPVASAAHAPQRRPATLPGVGTSTRSGPRERGRDGLLSLADAAAADGIFHGRSRLASEPADARARLPPPAMPAQWQTDSVDVDDALPGVPASRERRSGSPRDVATGSLEPEAAAAAAVSSASAASFGEAQPESGISTGETRSPGARLVGRSAASATDGGMKSRMQLSQALAGAADTPSPSDTGPCKRRRSARSSASGGRPSPCGGNSSQQQQQQQQQQRQRGEGLVILPHLRGPMPSARSAASSSGTPHAKRGRHGGKGSTPRGIGEGSDGGPCSLPSVSPPYAAPEWGQDATAPDAAPPTDRGAAPARSGDDDETPPAGSVSAAAPRGLGASTAATSTSKGGDDAAFLVRSKPSGHSEVLSIQEAINSMRV